ncbi:unnamed protein product [Macrosiphum euphorbiae]|uniref:Uncharacterized protein n=1 Tax=Macrosiphum euphorbiae TaxID=13131 RepID=A0AAV0VWU2_9HEMI|nr:unnamed protein product [Macrosiphum euphorbiae]
MCIFLDYIGEKPFDNIAITEHGTAGFRQSITVEILPDLCHLQSTDCVQICDHDIVTPEIQSAIPACSDAGKLMTML